MHRTRKDCTLKGDRVCLITEIWGTKDGCCAGVAIKKKLPSQLNSLYAIS